MNWLVFALMTVVSWGVYGAFLHTGQMGMKDAINGRYKAFLFVGIAYFLTAVLAPLAMLVVRGADWNYPKHGMAWSLLAGIVGAIGAFCVLLAFGAKGTPSVVMSIVFAGAPIVNALYSIWQHPPSEGLGSIKPQFYLGILLAAVGGCLVTLYKPDTAPAKPASAIIQSAPAAPKSQ
jgi:drug/metabolite transporter (DMT)-like permease